VAIVICIVHADARDTGLAAASVHAYVTSPPYFGLRRYIDRAMLALLTAKLGPKVSEIGAESTLEAYVSSLVEVGREVRRVLRDDGTWGGGKSLVSAVSRTMGFVLDPFGGAGTTAAVADALGRDGYHGELNADYLALPAERIAEVRAALLDEEKGAARVAAGADGVLVVTPPQPPKDPQLELFGEGAAA
jgi:DNA modification methylase